MVYKIVGTILWDATVSLLRYRYVFTGLVVDEYSLLLSPGVQWPTFTDGPT